MYGEIRWYRDFDEGPHAAAPGIAARITSQPRTGRREWESQQLREDLGQITCTKREAEHREMHANMQARVRLR